MFVSSEFGFSTSFLPRKRFHLTGLEQQNGNLSQVEVDEVLGLVRHIGTEVAADLGVEEF